MAKILYAGSASDFVVATTTVLASPSGTVDVLKLNPGAPLEAWNAGESGSQITDILLFTGTATAGSYTTPGGAAPSGIFPAEASSTFLFWAEDSLTEVFVCGQGVGVTDGQRWVARPINDTARLLALEALDPIGSAEKGAVSGVASLDLTGKVPTSQLPAGTGGVDSVNGDTGVVVLTAADVGAPPTTRKVTGTGPYLQQTSTGALSSDVAISAVVGTAAGTLAIGNHSHGGFTTSPRPVFAQVLSNDAPTEWKTAAAADPYTWVCDGTNDEVQWNLAADAAAPWQSRNAGMPAGAKQLGKVVGSAGEFNIGAAGIKTHTGVRLEGQGKLTILRAVGCNQAGLITQTAATDHLMEVADMTLLGNSGSGGTCSGINFNLTGGANTSSYPDSNPDSDFLLDNLYVFGFDANTSRNGVYLNAGSGDHNRGNMIRNLQVRSNYTNPGGTGIYYNGASDSYISNCHVGGYNIGYQIAGGNTKMDCNKSYYSNQYGVYITSGRALVSGHEAQDDDTGLFLDGVPATLTGLVVDTCNAAGIRFSNDRIQAIGFNVFVRSGGRYATQARGIWYDGTFTNCAIIGNVENSSITTPVSGTVPTGTNLVTIS